MWWEVLGAYLAVLLVVVLLLPGPGPAVQHHICVRNPAKEKAKEEANAQRRCNRQGVLIVEGGSNGACSQEVPQAPRCRRRGSSPRLVAYRPTALFTLPDKRARHRKTQRHAPVHKLQPSNQAKLPQPVEKVVLRDAVHVRPQRQPRRQRRHAALAAAAPVAAGRSRW